MATETTTNNITETISKEEMNPKMQMKELIDQAMNNIGSYCHFIFDFCCGH